jgi:hypothetical protein
MLTTFETIQDRTVCEQNVQSEQLNVQYLSATERTFILHSVIFLKISFVALFYLNKSKKMIVDQLLCIESIPVCRICLLRNEGCNLFVCLLKKDMLSSKIRRLLLFYYSN